LRGIIFVSMSVMRRMLLYALAVLVGLVTGVFSWALSEARLAVAALGVACIAGLCWAAQRFPRMRRVHLRVAAFLTLVGSIMLATWVPSTPAPWDRSLHAFWRSSLAGAPRRSTVMIRVPEWLSSSGPPTRPWVA